MYSVWSRICLLRINIVVFEPVDVFLPVLDDFSIRDLIHWLPLRLRDYADGREVSSITRNDGREARRQHYKMQRSRRCEVIF